MKKAKLQNTCEYVKFEDAYGNYILVCINPRRGSNMINSYYKKFIFDKVDEANNPLVEIVELFVNKDQRRKGIGSALLGKVVQRYSRSHDIIVAVGASMKEYEDRPSDIEMEIILNQLRTFYEVNGFIDVNKYFTCYQYTCAYMYKREDTTKRLTNVSDAEIKREISSYIPKHDSFERSLSMYSNGIRIDYNNKNNKFIRIYNAINGDKCFVCSDKVKSYKFSIDVETDIGVDGNFVYTHKIPKEYMSKETDYLIALVGISDSLLHVFTRIYIINEKKGKFIEFFSPSPVKVDNNEMELLFLPLATKEDAIESTNEANNVKKCIVVKAADEDQMGEIATRIHEQLVGNQDYIDSNIVLSMEPDGEETKNEIHVIIFNNSKTEPNITI